METCHMAEYCRDGNCCTTGQETVRIEAMFATVQRCSYIDTKRLRIKHKITPVTVCLQFPPCCACLFVLGVRCNPHRSQKCQNIQFSCQHVGF